MVMDQEALEVLIRRKASEIATRIKAAGERSANEAEFRSKVTRYIEDFAEESGLNLIPREEYTLVNGRADAVYNRFVIEYEPPRSLRENLSARTNQHAIEQVKKYMEGLVRLERHKAERLAGVAIDGSWFIFVRSKDSVWKIDSPVPVDRVSTERFLRTLTSLSTELALIPENLVRDFGENSNISRLCVSTLYEALSTTTNQKVKVLFEQWSLQFSEVCDYAEASKLSLPESALLADIIANYVKTSNWIAEPIDDNNPASPWISGRERSVRAVKKIVGQADYQAHAGSCTWANGIYWVEIVERRPDGLVLISNCGDVGKKKDIETVPPTAIEPNLLYPLLRGEDVSRWRAEPSLHIIMAQDPDKRCGWDEGCMKKDWPKTYAYLQRFKPQLQERSGYKKFFNPARDPFYSMYNVGPYTLAPYKVAWREVSTDLRAAVVEPCDTGRPIVPDHTLIAVKVDSKEEAHYLCTLLNSSVVNFIVRGYVALHPSPHVMKYIPVPKFSAIHEIHRALAKASTKAHRVIKDDQGEAVEEAEAEIDELAAKLWGLKKEELKDIQASLEDLKS
jgi:hypothetical protein